MNSKTVTNSQTPEHIVSELLGFYKAEWLDEKRLFDFFTEPTYFNELKTNRPCVLIGGRGTGKTTVLRGLSYQAQYIFSNKDARKIKDWPFYGVYYRVNTNRVTAFDGIELEESQWIKVFAHYINLVICQLLLDLVLWYENETLTKVAVPQRSIRKICTSLHLDNCDSLSELEKGISYATAAFEASINNIVDSPPTNLSIQGAPIDLLAQALSESESFSGKQFFILIDEFENFLDYQQRVLNTIIKHASASYTFKVGVRELGWRERATLNKNEQLTHPADYARINIREQILEGLRFKKFAESVIVNRLEQAPRKNSDVKIKIEDIFPSLGEDQEAELLLGLDYRSNILSHMKNELTNEEFSFVCDLSTPDLYFIDYWSKDRSHGSLSEIVEECMSKDRSWEIRRSNHFYAALFSIKRGKAGIRKYYCGWDTYVALANGNIRYLIELVHSAYINHFQNGGTVDQPISYVMQTYTAQDVGKKNLSELEGLSVEGARLTKLLLSLGRVFQVMAEQAVGHAPEVNQFHITPYHSLLPADTRNDIKQILDLAVMHQALVRFPGSKFADQADTKEYDYMIHPIFAAFFTFSHRRKRKFQLSSEQLIGLINEPRKTIRAILAQSQRTSDDEVPDQLLLFGDFYANN